MKTSKTQIRFNSFFALVIALFVFSTSTFAGGYEKMEPKPVVKVTSSNFDFFLTYLSNETQDESLALEDWMLNADSFVEEVISVVAFNEEKELSVENWMFDIEAFVPEDNEPELALENWMTDVDSFIENGLCTPNFALK
ncbi:hypothetical protein E9993_17700 [Labilibacter sediminis]|nr:hypothetical protein E9993_17700 [Labilibacter sediminis]